jgi:hypothetical protein
MASLLRPPLPGDEEDTRALQPATEWSGIQLRYEHEPSHFRHIQSANRRRRQIFQTDADLTPGLISGTLTLQ